MTSILPHELPQALDIAPAAKILSLDCFDTLLWRNLHAPSDLFCGLPCGRDQRRWAELNGRNHSALSRRTNEATLDEICAELHPLGPPEARLAAANAELAAEARHCFAFAPTVELICTARARGLGVIIVSDTYLDEARLRALIAASAGPDIAALIDRIFCSSDHRRSKHEGLFNDVLRLLDVNPTDLLHLGDNEAADLLAPRKLGIPAVHLRQFAPATVQRLRLEASVGTVLNGPGAAHQPHRALLAIGEPQWPDPAQTLGWSVLGPVFAAFSDWLRGEAKRLAATGKVHLLFLMRDGHLPHRVWTATGGLPGTTAAPCEISRFTAVAASLSGPDEVRRLLTRELGSGDIARIARQLLLTPREAREMKAANPFEFARKALTPAGLNRITVRSAEFAKRLCAHVRAACDPNPGDTLLLVDLGYNGTVQNAVEPVLRAAFDCHVAGRYLLLREQEVSGLDKAGLFGPDHFDPAGLDALCGSIAAIEQLATIATGSVVDYRPDGTPIREASGVKGRQSAIRDQVQDSAVAYAACNFLPWHRAPQSDCPDTRRTAAAATLARFLFLPLDDELAALEAFEHDVNLGGAEMIPLFDRTTACAELTRHGLFYLKGADRMFLPAELRGNGLPLSLALLAQRRFGLDLRRADFDESGFDLPIILAHGHEVTTQRVPASRTHDGYFHCTIPIGVWRFAVGLQFGALFEWVELKSADFLPAHALALSPRDQARLRAPATLTYEGLDELGPGILRAIDRAGFAMIAPAPPRSSGNPSRRTPEQEMVLSIVFRPLVSRVSAPLAPSALPGKALDETALSPSPIMVNGC